MPIKFLKIEKKKKKKKQTNKQNPSNNCSKRKISATNVARDAYSIKSLYKGLK